ncbi:hypothetical protein [Paraburkholderia sp. HP33-1]|uniref:hypothetical protein n=1 Tax=Paraburkholderia sp. HP33-1 TaxID=2883243 RepID=UPI001F44346C|nr:hypothetical protein [Paraburkholderia sp. HP33-1]
MAYQDDHRADAIATSITVRAAAGQLKIIPIWQAFGLPASLNPKLPYIPMSN